MSDSTPVTTPTGTAPKKTDAEIVSAVKPLFAELDENRAAQHALAAKHAEEMAPFIASEQELVKAIAGVAQGKRLTHQGKTLTATKRTNPKTKGETWYLRGEGVADVLTVD